jgi:ADP-ribose pyrophosphatase YjhB (NUDIX family)
MSINLTQVKSRQGPQYPGIGGIAETQELIEDCAARNIKAEIELIRPRGRQQVRAW